MPGAPLMFLDTQRNIIVYDKPDPDHTKYAEDVKPLANGYVGMPATLNNIQTMAFFGYDVPPVLRSDYDWPGRYTPFYAQYVTTNFLISHFRAFVLNDMGTGKTLSALWASDYLLRINPGFRAIIVCPLSIVDRIWGDNLFEHFMGKRDYVILHGAKKKRLDLLKQPHDYYIINFDGLKVIKKELAERKDIQIVIIDEGSAYRAYNTGRHRALRQTLLLRKYFWLMTGTPTSNGPLDAYGLAKLVNNAYGEKFTSYRDRTMVRVSNFRFLPKQGAAEEVGKMLAPAVRFSIDECVDLPSQLRTERHVEMSEEQRKAFKLLRDTCILYMKSGKPITAINEAVMRLKLIQIAAGAVYGPERVVHKLDVQPRITVLKEIIDECEGKIIIVAPLTSVLHLIQDNLSEYSTAIVNGELPPKECDRIIQEFQNEENPRILISDPVKLAHGLDLVIAKCVVWFAPTDRAELYLQLNKRIHRPGQDKETLVVNLASTNVERQIFKRMANNESLQGLTLELIKNG